MLQESAIRQTEQQTRSAVELHMPPRSATQSRVSPLSEQLHRGSGLLQSLHGAIDQLYEKLREVLPDAPRNEQGCGCDAPTDIAPAVSHAAGLGTGIGYADLRLRWLLDNLQC